MDKVDFTDSGVDMVAKLATFVSDAVPIAFSLPSLAVIALVVLTMTRVGRHLQRSLEWGNKQQRSVLGRLSVFGRLTAIGTDSAVVEDYGRKSHRASVGVRVMMVVASILILTTFQTLPAHEFPTWLRDHMQGAFILLSVILLYSNIQIWTFEVTTEAGTISIPNWTLSVKDHLLSDLVRVEKCGAAQLLLSFANGRRARIITHVSGSRDLLDRLQQAVDQNARG